MKNTVWIIILVVVILGAWLLIHNHNSGSTADTASSTYTTTSPDLAQTAQQLPAIGSLATADDIVISKPTQGDTVTSPIAVSGKARGGWFSEAVAPAIVIDTNGKTLGTGNIKATGDWMTTDMVPFTGTITFTMASDTPNTGAIVFMNDNPSGQASTSRFMAVPVYFQE